ncbi:MAG: OB-fold nucleic acid binding domain-containing protein [Chamaesiphon sp.]
MGKNNQESVFSIQGRFLGFVIEDGYKLKRLRLGTSEGEQSIKLSKELRDQLKWDLNPGDWFEIAGEKELNLKTGKVKLKAYRITPIVPRQTEQVSFSQVGADRPPKTKASILVCQKSDCQKRGGKAVCQALEASLSDRGLEDRVAIKGTGCMKHCKAGPNIVFMPDKTRYSRIDPKEIPALVEKHFPR